MTAQIKRISALLFCIFMMNLTACGTNPDHSDDPQAPLPPPAPTNTPRPAEQSFLIGTDTDHPALSNQDDATGPVRDTHITVQSGDRIEIKPESLVIEQRHVLPPKVTREDRNLCTQSGPVCIFKLPIFTEQCSNECHSYRPCNGLLCLPETRCQNVCHAVHTGDRCVFSETQCQVTQDQWVETSIYPGLDTPVTTTDTQPMDLSVVLAHSLKLRFSPFTPSDNPEHVDCPLAQFKPEIDAEKIVIHLRNVDGCPPIFGEGVKAQPFLSLVNAIGTLVPYSIGRLVKTWDGRVLAQPRSANYLPKVDFLGSLTVFAQPN